MEPRLDRLAGLGVSGMAYTACMPHSSVSHSRVIPCLPLGTGGGAQQRQGACDGRKDAVRRHPRVTGELRGRPHLAADVVTDATIVRPV
jgi:hypothetical protein